MVVNSKAGCVTVVPVGTRMAAALRAALPPSADEVPVYQVAIRRLTAENKRLRHDQYLAAAAHRSRVNELEALLREGLSPETTALTAELRRWRDRALAAEGRLASMLRDGP